MPWRLLDPPYVDRPSEIGQVAGLGVVPGHLLPNIVVLVKLGLLKVAPRDSNRSMPPDLDIYMYI